MLWGLADVFDALGKDAATAGLALANPWTLLSANEKVIDEDQLIAGLDEIIAGLDQLMTGIEVIDAETDDQSNDLIPSNLLRLEGEFKLPGILLPTPVDQLLEDLGINPDELFNGEPMPDALLELLQQVRNVIQLVRNLLALG